VNALLQVQALQTMADEHRVDVQRAWDAATAAEQRAQGLQAELEEMRGAADAAAEQRAQELREVGGRHVHLRLALRALSCCL